MLLIWKQQPSSQLAFIIKYQRGALLLVSDQPMIPEGVLKTESSDKKVTEIFVETHLKIGIDSLKQLINDGLTVRTFTILTIKNMKNLISALYHFFLLSLQKENLPQVEKKKTATYKGRLEIKGNCMNYTIKLLAGNINTSLIDSTWTDETTK